MRLMLLLWLLPSIALAQPPAPPSGAGLPPNVPIPPEKSIPLDQALDAAQAALAACTARNSPATVEVMDLNYLVADLACLSFRFYLSISVIKIKATDYFCE